MAVESKAMDHIRKVLEQFGDKYFSKSGALKRNAVIEDLDNYDKDLMTAILKDDLLHKTYTSKIADVEIFEINKFVDMLRYKEYWEDSFTKYDNKIGLTAGGKYIDDSSDVVLDFPYKDCVLKAGMTKEDVEHSGDADEPFLNETLAKPEIDELFEPKIFINVTKYDKNGKTKASSISDDDNLIIKGNNLIALYSLEERYAGKVKLIYLDPPYNTSNHDFVYNDNFNHATWLTFMKSRLEIAWKLLSDDGTIWISIDDNESHYMKVLEDSIFGRENFLDEVVWQRAYSPVNLKKTFSRSHDYIQVYAKNNSSEKELNRLPRSAEANSRYKNPDNDPRGAWKPGDLSVGPAVKENIYPITTPSGRTVLPPNGRSWVYSKDKFNEMIKDNRIWFGKDGINVPSVKRFLSDVKGVVAQTLWTYEEVGHNQDAKREIKKLFNNNSVFTTPKPEKLLRRIITLGSNEKDLVLDFFMGSATTQAVAMKMHRRFIGIEQMDYINTISVPRLQKVIAGEQGGISKAVKWQGGGSFIYAELMEKDQGYIRDLQNAENMDELMNVYSRMKQNGDIDDESVRDLVTDTDYEFNKSFYSSNNEKGEE